MADSVQASEAGLEQIDRARRRKHWNKTAETWCRKAFTSRATLNRFWAKQPIRREAFIAICSAVEVDWETVANEDTSELSEVAALGGQSSPLRAAASPVNFAAPAAPIPTNFIPATETVASLYLNGNDRVPSSTGVVDWGDAPAVTTFCGRSLELETLSQWIVTDRCRSIALLGMGGMGKTTLAAKLAHTVHPQFPSLVWRSLRNAPPVGEMLADLIQILGNQQVEEIAERIDGKIRQLIDYLRQSRCLLILDNVESILLGGDRSGGYQPQYEGYGQLFRSIWETEHQSCVLLTSREPPNGLVLREGEGCPVRSFNVLGVSSSDGRTICNTKGTFAGSDRDWQQFTERFGGNPLALQLAAATIRDFFAGSLTQFLQLEEREEVLFDDINALLQQQFQRLPPLEKAIMIWLAIAREPITLAELDADCLCHRSTSELMQSLVSLQRRSLVEANDGRFTQQPVLMEFVTRYLVEQVCEEVLDQRAELFCTHVLVKAQANDYIRDSQVAMILAPIVTSLLERLGSAKAIEVHLRPVLDDVRAIADSDQPPPLPEVSSPLGGAFAPGQQPRARDRRSNQTGYVCSNAIALLKHLQLPLAGYDFSHLTVWQANLRDIDLHGVNFSKADLSDSLFTELLGLTLAIAYSPDDSMFATAGANGKVHLWSGTAGNTSTGLGQKLGTLCGHDGWIWSLAFSSDGKTLASGSENGAVALWDVDSQHRTAVLDGQCSQIWAVAFSPDGKTLACGCEDGSVKLWDITTKASVAEFNGQCRWIRSIAFSPDGTMLACAGDASAIALWDVAKQTCVRTFEGHTIDRIWAIAFSPDGCRLASSCSDRTVRVWDVSTGDCLHVLEGHANWVRSLAISPLGDVIASGSEDHTIKVWDIDSGQCLKTLRGHSNWVRAIAFSPDGHLLVSGSGDHTVRLWTVSTGFCQKTLQGYTSRVWSVAFAPDGKTLASSHDDRAVRLWSVSFEPYQTPGSCQNTLRESSGSWVSSVAFSPDGRWLASASSSAIIRIWDASSSQCLQALQGHTSRIWSVAFSPDGRTLASASEDGTVRVWSLDTGACQMVLDQHSSWVCEIAFSPDGQTLASASYDNTAKLWDIQSGTCLDTLSGHDNWVWTVAFSPDGKTLATGSGDSTIKLWDVRKRSCRKTLKGHSSRVWSIAFSPSGEFLASSSSDRTVRIWEVYSGKCLHVLNGHTNIAWSVAFSPQGEMLASGSQDETIRLWDTSTGDCIQVLKSARPYEGMNISGVRGITDACKQTLMALGAVAQ